MTILLDRLNKLGKDKLKKFIFDNVRNAEDHDLDAWEDCITFDETQGYLEISRVFSKTKNPITITFYSNEIVNSSDDEYCNRVYEAAKKADQQFCAAIKEQFGKNSGRWDHSRCDYNIQTLVAYYSKIALDNLWLDIVRSQRC